MEGDISRLTNLEKNSSLKTFVHTKAVFLIIKNYQRLTLRFGTRSSSYMDFKMVWICNLDVFVKTIAWGKQAWPYLAFIFEGGFILI